MASKKFKDIEIDAIGEIMNISLGASATAISTMLDTRVDITTPFVRVVTKKDFSFSNLQPAVGVEINYISGLNGNNVMLLKRADVKTIIELLMGMEIPDEEFELDEMNVSAICEVMNQMMGASSTALSEFLGKTVNISTPQSFEIANEDEFKDIYFEDEEQKVVIGFTLTIDEKMESEFVNVMSVSLAKELVLGILPESALADDDDEEPETVPVPDNMGQPFADAAQANMYQQPIQPMQPMQPMMPMMQQPMQPMQQTQPAQQMQQPFISNDAFLSQQMMMQQMMQQMQQMQEQLKKAKEPDKKVINAMPASHAEITGYKVSTEDQPENLSLVMGVPLEVSVEIGRTQSLVKDILEYTKGTLVILDKQAGDQVDLFVNGQCIARGDVVVVDDNFGIRITEILKRPSME